MINLPPLPSIPLIRAGLITRRLQLAGGGGRGPHFVATGRTGSGKTTLGNRLLGIDYFLSTGSQDCTQEVNFIRFPGGLSYADLPGVASDDRLENFNRAALGLPQVADFPTVTELTVAEYSAGGPPRQKVMRASDFAPAYPVPDLILYVLAADKQLTRSDYQYLKDLLVRHHRVIFVLNVFATSPPTEANIHDLVSKVAAVHRQVVPGQRNPHVVALDCRTGDGLTDLLEVARSLPDGDDRQALTDLIADQERQTPLIFARELQDYLARQAVQAAALRAGPVGSEHPLHRFTATLGDMLDTLRDSAPAMGSCARRYRSIIAAALAAPLPAARLTTAASVSIRATALIEMARGVRETTLKPAVEMGEKVLAAVKKTFQALGADSERREAALAATVAGLKSEQASLEAQEELFKRAREGLESRIAERNAEADRIQARQIEHASAAADHAYELERHEDMVQALNEVAEQINDGGARVDESVHRHLNREADRLNRNRDRINRRADRLNREAYEINKEVAAFQAGQSPVEDKLRQLKTLQESLETGYASYHKKLLQLARQEHDHRRLLTAEEWVDKQFVGPCNQALERLHQACGVLTGEVERLVRRARELNQLAPLPRFNSQAADSELDEAETRLLAMARNVTTAAAKIRRLWGDCTLNRAVNALLIQATTDHFDEAGSASHRGSTYAPLARDGMAHLLAVGHLAVSGKDPATDYPLLFQAVRSILDQLSPSASEEESINYLRMQSDLFSTDLEAAVDRFEVFAGKSL